MPALFSTSAAFGKKPQCPQSEPQEISKMLILLPHSLQTFLLAPELFSQLQKNQTLLHSSDKAPLLSVGEGVAAPIYTLSDHTAVDR